MITHDKQHRPYANISQLKAGDTVTVDGDLTCCNPWETKILKSDSFGLFFDCNEGTHHLSGQVDDGENCVGIYAGIVTP